MGIALEDIAAGVDVTTVGQRDRGVPTVDDTGAELLDRVHADALPCTPEAAATVVEAHADGASVGEGAREADVAPITAAKALHRCGVVGVSPLAPTARRVLRDWLAGDLPRTDALALSGADEAEFALATYVETHDAVPELIEAVEGAVAPDRSATAATRDALGETMSDPTELL